MRIIYFIGKGKFLSMAWTLVLCCVTALLSPAVVRADGPYGNGTVERTFPSSGNFAPHSHLRVSFELELHGTWDGNASSPYGPDRWSFRVAGMEDPLYAGALRRNPRRRTITKIFAHSDDTVRLLFSASGTGGDEKWSIHNLRVIPIQVQLTIGNTTQELTQTTQLRAGLNPALTVTRYQFQIKRTISNRWYTLSTRTTNSFSWRRRVAGQFHLRVAVTSGSNVFYSPNIYAATQFPDYATITASATAATRTNTAWSSTKSATTAMGRREEGFWIRLNTAGTGTYEFSATFYGPTVGPDTGASATPGAMPQDNPLAPAPNAAGVQYTVALFHTHTPTTYRSVGRPVGPSGADDNFHNSNNVVGVVYDYTEVSGGNIPARHPLHSPARRYHSGPDRRPTP